MTQASGMHKFQSMIALLLRLWHHIERVRRFQLGILFVVMLIVSLAEVVSIGMILPFLTALTKPELVFQHRFAQPLIHLLEVTSPKALLFPLTLLFVLTVVISAAIRLAMIWIQAHISHAIGVDAAVSIYRRTLYQPYSVHVSRNSSEIIAGISSKVNGVLGSTIGPALIMLSSGLILVTILIALIAIDPLVAVSSFVGFGAIYAVIVLLTKKRLAVDSQRISRESNLVIKALQEGLGGIRDVLVDGTQDTYCEIYRNADAPLRKAQANVQIISSTPRFGIEALGMTLIAILAYVMAIRPEGILAAIPVLGALALGAQRMLPVLQQTYSSWSLMIGGKDSLRDALDLLDQPLPAHANTPNPLPIPFSHHIHLQDISFRYAQHAPWILKKIDLVIPKGSRVGFIGSTGSGKSTLLDIVMGLLEPTEGAMSIDGNKVTMANHRAWQVHIAHVPQAIFLADASIAENIAFGLRKELIDFERVKIAAQKAQIAEIIESWEDQYETTVGERGIRLSGGQRQRIGIARALYKQADVIIFDEATSALDHETETAVMQAIENLGDDLTILIVAHRLTTLRNCAQVVSLSDGRIERVGSYAQIVGLSSVLN
jgi:ABC-type multidrug transport system fused ATPase/permease subunit